MRGKCWTFGNDVNTDEIIPARYLNVTDEAELAAHCMEGIDEEFADRVGPGDLLVGGRNFGCGSSREHAPICIKAAGIQCVVAESFARIFFRNAINVGLPIAECPEAAQEAETGDEIEVDLQAGRIVNHTKGKAYSFPRFSAQLQAIIDAGGLIPYARQTLST
ncbi:MAG: 3-isopropylmalate dehydratase small subunit [Candidatus Brocadiaceae bacterium]|jgi:3-isopropylmalate/(R)-2-methylmalate dehydratase small subunit